MPKLNRIFRWLMKCGLKKKSRMRRNSSPPLFSSPVTGHLSDREEKENSKKTYPKVQRMESRTIVLIHFFSCSFSKKKMGKCLTVFSPGNGRSLSWWARRMTGTVRPSTYIMCRREEKKVKFLLFLRWNEKHMGIQNCHLFLRVVSLHE